MKSIIFEGAQNGCKWGLRADTPMPIPKQGESLVRILLAAVCNTDREVAKGYRPNFCGVMGHEFVGMVEESDDKTLIGKRVVGELNEGCGECLYCTTGREHHCTIRRVPGLDGRDGCFAEYMAYPTRLLHIVPNNLPTTQAIFCEPLAAALEIVEKNHIPPSTTVAIVGDGRLALMIAQVIAANGTPLAVFGLQDDKLNLFKEYAAVSKEPGGSFEIVIEATGSPSGLKTAIALCRSEGLIVLKSTYAGMAEVNMSEVVVRELHIAGSRCGPFAPALNMLKRGLVNLPAIALYPIEEYESAFNSPAFKSGFDFRRKDDL